MTTMDARLTAPNGVSINIYSNSVDKWIMKSRKTCLVRGFDGTTSSKRHVQRTSGVSVPSTLRIGRLVIPDLDT